MGKISGSFAIGVVIGIILEGSATAYLYHTLDKNEWACTQPIVQEKPLEVDCAQFTRDDS